MTISILRGTQKNETIFNFFQFSIFKLIWCSVQKTVSQGTSTTSCGILFWSRWEGPWSRWISKLFCFLRRLLLLYRTILLCTLLGCFGSRDCYPDLLVGLPRRRTCHMIFLLSWFLVFNPRRFVFGRNLAALAFANLVWTFLEIRLFFLLVFVSKVIALLSLAFVSAFLLFFYFF